jgi:hypothetical protein
MALVAIVTIGHGIPWFDLKVGKLWAPIQNFLIRALLCEAWSWHTGRPPARC